MPVPPGAHWLVVKLETCMSSSDLRQRAANHVKRDAKSVLVNEAS